MVLVAIVDDQPLMRAGIVSCLEEADGIEVVGEGDRVNDVTGRPPDVVVLSGDSDVDLGAMRRRWSQAALVLYASSAGLEGAAGTPEGLLASGVAAVVARETSSAALVAAVRAVAAGRTYVALAPIAAPATDAAARDCTLTRREREVLQTVADGLSNSDIAARLAISEHTVKSHLHQAMRKLEADTRAAAVHHAALQALI